MNKNNIIIRLERKEEYREVENLVRESFWNVYRPGCLEHYVLNQLRNDEAFVPELDFVMEKDGVIIGQNIFMRAVIKADDGRDIPIMTMGPICIAPELKCQGYGKILLDYSQKRWAAVRFALKETLISTAEADLSTPVNTVSVTTDFRKEKMHHFSSAES